MLAFLGLPVFNCLQYVWTEGKGLRGFVMLTNCSVCPAEALKEYSQSETPPSFHWESLGMRLGYLLSLQNLHASSQTVVTVPVTYLLSSPTVYR